MSKQKIFLDFDDTIVQSSKSFCDTYNQMYKDYSNFIPADYKQNTKWNYKEVCPLIKYNHIEMFENPYFFMNLQFYPYAYEVLEKLSYEYEIIICSIGTLENIELKSYWIRKHLPFINNVILISNEGCKMDKSIVNMQDSIFIDDVASNLFSSNAENTIGFIADGKFQDWNKEWKGSYVKNWRELYEILK